jgi:hypothetical protein
MDGTYTTHEVKRIYISVKNLKRNDLGELHRKYIGVIVWTGFN